MEEVRNSGPDPNNNFKLKTLIAKGRQINMPMDNIERAIKVRASFNKRGGSLGEPNCVAWMFDEKGVLTISREESNLNEDAAKMLKMMETFAE